MNSDDETIVLDFNQRETTKSQDSAERWTIRFRSADQGVKLGKLGLYSAVIQNSRYNMRADSITTDLGTTLNIAPGDYDTTTLQTLVTNLLTGLGHLGVNVSYDSTTGKWTVQTGSNFDIILAAGSIWYVLGFTSNKTGATSYESDVKYSVKPEVYLISLSHGSKTVRTAQRQATFIINEDYGDDWTSFQDNELRQTVNIGAWIQELEIKITDAAGDPVSMNGGYACIVLKNVGSNLIN